MKEKNMRILILGLDNAGKSSIVARWLGDDQGSIDMIAPTFGFEIHDIQCQEGYTATVWDIGGQESIRPFWRSYYEGETDAVCFVIDSADIDRIAEARRELEKVLMGTEETRQGSRGASVLIMANKQDLKDAHCIDEIKERLDLDLFSSTEHDMHIMPCSAMHDAASCRQGLSWIVESVRRKRSPGAM